MNQTTLYIFFNTIYILGQVIYNSPHTVHHSHDYVCLGNNGIGKFREFAGLGS